MKLDAEVMIALALVALGVLLATRGKQAASSAYTSFDGTLTDAAFSIPGMTVFQDAAGNFDPVQAGYEAGAAVRNAVVNAANSAPPAEGLGAMPTSFGNYVSL